MIWKSICQTRCEIITGGAKGVDASAKAYALTHHMKLTEFLPEYKKYKRGAPLNRNLQIIDYADLVVAFWNGKSKGTKYVIDNCEKKGKAVIVHQIAADETIAVHQ